MYEILYQVMSLMLIYCKLFQKSIRKFWANQELTYNFRSEINGTGSRSEVVY